MTKDGVVVGKFAQEIELAASQLALWPRGSLA